MFGFEQKGSLYIYHKTLPGSGFKLTVNVTTQGEISSEIIDPSVDEPYTLHLVDGAAGSFVGKIRSQYEETLAEIADRCFELNVFQSKLAKELIAYVRNTYGDELEYLWQKFPDNAVWRRRDTAKWYGALLIIPKQKLDVNSGGLAEIIDLRVPPEEMEALLDGEAYYPGYHMNKKHWCSILLDGTVDLEEICRRIDKSYQLAVK